MNNPLHQEIGMTEALKFVGDKNKYQYCLFFIFTLIVFCNGFALISPTYQFLPPKLYCDGNICDDTIKNCDTYKEIILDPTFKYENLVTDFDLYCKRKIFISIYQSITFAGSIFGGVIVSLLGDRFGRRTAWVVSCTTTTLGSIGIVTSFNVYQLIFSNFIVGLGLIPCYVVGFVILNEVSSEAFRQKGSIFLLVFLALVEIIIAAIYYLITSWRYAYIITVTLPAIIALLLGYRIILETPKYFISKKNTVKAYQVLDQIAKFNNQPSFSEYANLHKEQLRDELIVGEQFEQAARYTYLDLFQYKSLRGASIGFMGISFAIHIIFYGSQYGIDEVAEGDMLYLMGALVGVAEMLGYFSMNFVIEKLPRKTAYIFSFFITQICCFAFLFFGFKATAAKTDCNFCLKEIEILIIVCFIRFFNSSGFALIAIYPNEFYPTCIRSTGSGFVFTIGILGSFFSPYVISIGDFLNVNPYICIGMIAFIGPLGCLFIKETLNKPLEDELEENRIDNKDHFRE